jgi:hypothetical protein
MSTMDKKIPLMIVLLLILSACAPPALPNPTPTAWETPQPTETKINSGAPTIEPTLASLQLAIYPPESRTGLTGLDLIIDTILDHDYPGLKDLSSYLITGCTNTEGLGGPPQCAEGEVEGTMLEVIPFLGPEGHHSRRTDYESWNGPDALGLLAVYSTSSGTYSDPIYPAGEYALVFLLSSGIETVTLQVDAGKIIRYDYNFNGLSEKDLEERAEDIILPLSFRPIPTAVPWNVFDDHAGRFRFVYPPSLVLLPADVEDSWHFGNRIRVEVLTYDQSWITCFYQSVGDCPFVETDQSVEINGKSVRRIEGYIGSVGGYTPQEFLTYIFNLDEKALVMTIYALPFGTAVSDITQIWPLEGMDLELFERTVGTVQISE